MSNVVRARLIADGTVSGLVGARVYMMDLEQDCAMPAIATSPVDEDPQNTLDGEQSTLNAQWEIDCWAKTYAGAETLADAVESAMATAGTDFTAIRIGREVVFDNTTDLRGVSLEYSLWI